MKNERKLGPTFEYFITCGLKEFDSGNHKFFFN